MTRSLIFALLALSACGTDPSLPVPGDALGSGARMQVDYLGDTDVAGFHFVVERVACDVDDVFDPFTLEANVDFEDYLFPGEVQFLGATLDPTSSHIGSDLFVSLDAGCYDITATPASALDVDDPTSWTPSEDCATASVAGVEVFDGQTTDVTLISQCNGDEVGALDVLAVLNHPPTLAVTVADKFALECEPVEVCVTVTDPDDDPVEIVLDPNVPAGEWIREVGPLEIVGWDAGVRTWQQCFTIIPHDGDDYDYTVYAYDLLTDGTHIEDVVAPEPSHDELTFPIYVSNAAVAAPYCHADGQLVMLGEVSLDEACAQDLMDPQTYWCGGGDGDDENDQWLCDADGNLIVEAAYPPCDLEEVTLRVGFDNALHVWLDGQPVDAMSGDSWAVVQTETFLLAPGEHTFALYVENWSGPSHMGAVVEIAGVPTYLSGDGSWLEVDAPYTSAIATPWDTNNPGTTTWSIPPVDGTTGLFGVPVGWIDPTFDDSAWVPAAACTNKAMSLLSTSYQPLVDAGADFVWQGGSCDSAGATTYRLTFTL